MWANSKTGYNNYENLWINNIKITFCQVRSLCGLETLTISSATLNARSKPSHIPGRQRKLGVTQTIYDFLLAVVTGRKPKNNEI